MIPVTPADTVTRWAGQPACPKCPACPVRAEGSPIHWPIHSVARVAHGVSVAGSAGSTTRSVCAVSRRAGWEIR
ncbi:hypothetical protein [Microbispora catharanthi]|uniref:hypothetical protein n=1 Tax=Microbispora catharanthi TaxID=1712871 RepID=UPI00111B3E64|nr:hypothetical protein [Microbispora catharanthi]